MQRGVFYAGQLVTKWLYSAVKFSRQTWSNLLSNYTSIVSLEATCKYYDDGDDDDFDSGDNGDGDSDDDDDAEPFGQERGKNYVRAIAFFVFPPPSANITGPCDWGHA